MIKKFLNTLLVVISVFLLIIVFGFVSSLLNKNTCSAEKPDCPEDFLCNLNKKACVPAEKCPEQKPEVCITLYDPVCSNGKEYSNGCFACMADVTSFYKGPC
ncbi:MAG: hypothetical protein AABW58_02530 [Nanoarchaeota archaeon]